MCVEPGKMCMHDMISIDARGGAGIAGIQNVRSVTYDKFAARGTGSLANWSVRYVAALCSQQMKSADRPDAKRVNPAPLKRSEEHTSELQSLMRISYSVFCLKQTHNRSTRYRTRIYTDYTKYLQ